jgi:hypothetical protein
MHPKLISRIKEKQTLKKHNVGDQKQDLVDNVGDQKICPSTNNGIGC